jgi:hypothetical protein
MKRLILLMPLTLLWLISCKQEEKILIEKEVTFSITNPAQRGSTGGRITEAAVPKSVLVTIKGSDGRTVVEHKELTLYKFGENFLSLPLTLKTTGASKYSLTEFMVVNADNKVSYATPKEGSKLAHLVADPLDIEFAVMKDEITTVTPEVLAVDETTHADDFGYGQFGFKVVKTISAVFSAFIKGASNFELTTAHLKIHGLRDTTSTDTTSLWVYDTDLEAKANIVQLKEAAWYRVTSTKQGYASWTRTLAVKNNDKIEILFEEKKDSIDVYVAGYEKNASGKWVAKYWKNGQAMPLSDGSKDSYANSVYVRNGDVYVAGYEEGGRPFYSGIAKYWKNGTPFNLTGQPPNVFTEARAISVSPNGDVHVAGVMYSTNVFNDPQPVYWKNGNLMPLTNGAIGEARSVAINGTDIYIVGSMVHGQPSYGVYWKNGGIVPLAANQNTRAYANSVTIHNSDVYVCGTYWDHDQGHNYNRAIYWKNNVAFPVEDLSRSSIAFSIAVSGNVVHMTGWDQVDGTVTGKYWENGKAVPLRDNGIYPTVMYSVAALADQVYIAGSATEKLVGTSMAYLWINRKPVKLGNRESFARSIFLVER